jgi:hypothetical protein
MSTHGFALLHPAYNLARAAHTSIDVCRACREVMVVDQEERGEGLLTLSRRRTYLVVVVVGAAVVAAVAVVVAAAGGAAVAVVVAAAAAAEAVVAAVVAAAVVGGGGGGGGDGGGAVAAVIVAAAAAAAVAVAVAAAIAAWCIEGGMNDLPGRYPLLHPLPLILFSPRFLTLVRCEPVERQRERAVSERGW